MPRTDRAALLLHHDRDQVFAALTERAALEQWMAPPGMRVRFERFDMVQGGSYRLVISYDDPSGSPGRTTADSDVSEARIVELVPGDLVVHEVRFESDDPAFAGTMRMAFSLHADPGGAELRIEATGVPEGVAAGDHAEGITASLVGLARRLERG